MIPVFVPGQRVVCVEDGVPQHATVLEVYRVSCTVRFRKDGLTLTVPMAWLRTCPMALARCGETPRGAA